MKLKKIIRYLLNPQTIKIVGLIFIVSFFFFDPTFANTTVTTQDSLKTIQEGLKNFIAICSRGWIILAMLAGKLMTNDFVYGAFLHMDIYLWKIWNIMKNFANFALVALVLGSIIKSLIGKEALDVKKILTNTLLAGILIQASWFLMGAVIDVSTVATAAISAFPTSFLSSDAGLTEKISTGIQSLRTQRLSINLENTDAIRLLPTPAIDTEYSNEDIWKSIMPRYNSVSGPFIYLGMAVFHFQDYLGTQNTNDTQTLTLSFALRFFFLFFFTIGLLLLFIANILRIGLLRMFIIGSPFLILLQLFKPKTGSGGIFKLFSLSNLIATIFKPLIFVIGISLMLIVVVSMQKGMLSSGLGRENNLNGVSLSKSGPSISTLSVDGITNISVDQTDLLGPNVIESGKNFFSSIIILLLTIFLMRRFVKLSLTTGGGTIADIMKDLTKKAEEMAKTMPILPFKGGAASFGALQSFSGKNRDKLFNGMGLDKSGSFGQINENGSFQTNQEVFNDFVNSKIGLQKGWSNADYTELNKIAKGEKFTQFFSTSQAKAKEREGGLSINDNNWMSSLEYLLKNKEIDKINASFNTPNNIKFSKWLNNQTAEEYFKNQNNVQALYYAMEGPTTAPNKGIPDSYDKLKEIIFNPGK